MIVYETAENMLQSLALCTASGRVVATKSMLSTMALTRCIITYGRNLARAHDRTRTVSRLFLLLSGAKKQFFRVGVDCRAKISTRQAQTVTTI